MQLCLIRALGRCPVMRGKSCLISFSFFFDGPARRDTFSVLVKLAKLMKVQPGVFKKLDKKIYHLLVLLDLVTTIVPYPICGKAGPGWKLVFYAKWDRLVTLWYIRAIAEIAIPHEKSDMPGISCYPATPH